MGPYHPPMPPMQSEAASSASVAAPDEVVAALQVVLALAVVVGLVVTVARKLEKPYPILLVVAGLALGLIDGFPRVELEPELVLVAILPPLLFAAAWQTPIRDFRANRRAIVLLSVGLVVFTAIVVAFALTWADPTIPFAAALALGAIVAPRMRSRRPASCASSPCRGASSRSWRGRAWSTTRPR